MFINFTHEPSQFWIKEQVAAANAFGPIVDIPLPIIDPYETVERISELASDYVSHIQDELRNGPSGQKGHAILLAGEYTFLTRFLSLWRKMRPAQHIMMSAPVRIVCLVTGRVGDVYKFVQFRELSID